MPLKLTEKQKQGLEILCDPDKTRILFTGGSRAGKTALITEFLIGRAYQFPGSRQGIFRRAMTDVRTSMWHDTLKKYLQQFIPDDEYTMYQTELRIVFKNGSEILCGGLDDSDRMQKILGTEFITIFCNEATELKFDAVNTLITRLAQKVYDLNGEFVAVNKLILDCNPRNPRHWLKIWALDHKDPTTKPLQPIKDPEKFASLHWTPYDNIENLPEGYIQQLDNLPYEMRERMLLGKWCGGAGAIFREFNERLHVIEPFKIPKSWALERAIDFGYNHPCGVLWSAYDYVTDTIYIYREFKESGKTIDEIGQMLNDVMEKHNEFYEKTWADHDLSDRKFLQKQGIYTSPAKKDVLSGISAVRRRMMVDKDIKQPRLKIFSTCTALIDEIINYSWHESNSEVSDKDSPIKQDDDLVDPLRYLVYGRDKAGGGLF